MAGKQDRLAAVLRIIGERRIGSQEALRRHLADAGFEVTQATLSRDIRELGLVKLPGTDGAGHYGTAAESETIPSLRTLLPALFLSAEGTGNLLVVRTMTGSASSVALALDWEGWPEILGTIAGDDTILVICRDPGQVPDVRTRLEALARRD